MLRDIGGWIKKLAGSSEQPPSGTGAQFDEYVNSAPSNQNAIDCVPGWNHALPPQAGVTAGKAFLYNDPRIIWAIEQFGSIENCNILELGPLEASHTYLIDKHNPKNIDAVEANRLAYLRCLIAKEILELKHAKFYLGNFVPWLENSDRRYDFIFMSGVLYHMHDPVRSLELVASRTDAFYLWTHYFDEEALPLSDPRRKAFLENTRTQNYRGIEIHLHERSYHNAWKDKAFCGGIFDQHYWMEKAELLNLIEALGFDDIRIAHDDPQHQNGPSLSIFARRSGDKSEKNEERK